MKILDVALVAAQGIFVAGMFMTSTPAMSQACPPTSNDPACSGATPAPLVAAGIPGLLTLGGGYLAIRKRRRANRAKK
ncbi:MAG: LPXTG cell wall anchor domain-containing protein [Sphingomicrobium sp.]